jgi:hypothetical protein
MPNRRLLARRHLALALAFALVGGTARAQDARDESKKQDAAVLVARAQQACASGSHADALGALTSAYDSYPHARIRYRLGIEHQHLGQVVEAIETLERYVAEPEREAEYAADAVSRINQLRPGVGELDILGEPGTTVAVDGRTRGTTPLARLRLPAGTHIVSASRRGYVPFETTVQVIGGRTAAVHARLEPQSASAPLWLGETAPPSRSPAEIGLLMSGGIWMSGPGEPLSTLGAVIGGSYRLRGERLSLHVGPRLTVNTIRDLEVTVLALGMLVAPMAKLELVPERFSASLELGGGLLVLSGLRARSVLLVPEAVEVTGVLGTFTLRPSLTFEYRVSRDLALLMAMAAAWSPRPDPAFRDQSLVHFDLALGLSWSF